MKTTNFKTSKKIAAPINGTDSVMLKYLSMRVYLVVVSLTIVATSCVSRQRHGASKSVPITLVISVELAIRCRRCELTL